MRLLDPLKVELKKNVLIEASAGTGKTYTITTLFTRLVVQGFSVDSILVVTFTEAAAAELKDRIRQRLAYALSAMEAYRQDSGCGEITDELVSYLIHNLKEDFPVAVSRIRRALVCFDEASVMTIHSFCFRILRENAFETGALFDVELIPDVKSVVREIVLDFMTVEINKLDFVFLKFLKRKKFKIQNLIPLFKRFMSRPHIEIIPESEHTVFCDVSRDYVNTCNELLDILEHGKDEIKEIFLHHEGVNRKSYRKKSVEKWLDKAQADLLQLNVFDMTEKGATLYKFTNTRLKEKNKKNRPVPQHLFFDLCDKLMDICRVLERNITAVKIGFFSFLTKELEIKKENLGICFFDDIVNGLADALESSNSDILVSAIRKKFSAALIDEFQDTDQRQYSIFSKIFSGTDSPFFMIGDPKQAIYAFRGGDIFAYLKAVRDTAGRAYTLEKNWRSDPFLVDAVNMIFMGSDNPFLFKEIGFNPVTTPSSAVNRFMKNGSLCAPFQFLFIPAKTGETDKTGFIKKEWARKKVPLIVADDIASLLNSDIFIMTDNGSQKRLVAGDIAVLVRTNEQAEIMNYALSRSGVPSYISRTGSVFDSDEATEMADLLCAVLEPDNPGLICAALCGSLFNLIQPGILFSDVFLSSYNSDCLSMQQWHSMFKNWKCLWTDRGIIIMLHNIFHSGYAMACSENPNGNSLSERTLTNYFHLAELLHRAEAEKHLSPFALFKWFLNQLVPEMREQFSDELRLETDAGAVSIITIHKSKGMEYPVVYLPYLWESVIHAERDENPVFHDPDDENKEKIDLGSELIQKSRQRAVFEEQAENMRLLYVGLTRAVSMCRIVWGNFKSVEKSSLFSLIHRKSDEADHGNAFSYESVMLDELNDLKKRFSSEKQTGNRILIDFYDNTKATTQYSDINKDQDRLEYRQAPFEITQAWQFTSFSMIAAMHGENIKQYDSVENRGISVKVDNDEDDIKITLADFPKGQVPGNLIHSIFEHIDFKDESHVMAEIIGAELSKYGFDPLKWTDTFVRAFSEILATPLFCDAFYCGKIGNTRCKDGINGKRTVFCLKDIGRAFRLNEMEFIFPVKFFSRHMLADVFKNHMNDKASSVVYAERLSELHFDTVKGFMKGFIDLVFKFGNKWYIVDYKSNFLGDRYSDYSKAAMISSMAEHHYFLQYHLYVTALHRFLKFKIKDYRYQTDFGGVLYLFIRGMHPEKGSKTGVFYDLPGYDMVKQLSALF